MLLFQRDQNAADFKAFKNQIIGSRILERGGGVIHLYFRSALNADFPYRASDN